MKEKIKKYVDKLFIDIYDTKQLHELKEEISLNLIEKVNDFISKGNSEEEAFKKAVSSLGDMSELIDSLKKASETKFNEDIFPLDKSHIVGYIVASAISLLGLLSGGIFYLMQKDLKTSIMILIPFLLISIPIFIYYGLTQETNQDYGMNSRRATFYSVASELLLIGLAVSGFEYLNGQKPFLVLSVLSPFILVSIILFIYLGLTERSRRKMDSIWEKSWVEYYRNPQTAMLRGSISGVLWILTITAFFVGGFSWSWKYSWIALVIATALEIVIEAIFTMKRKNNA